MEAEKKERKDLVPVFIMGKRYDVPSSLTIQKALGQMGYPDFVSVRSGKFFELEFSSDAEGIDRKIQEVCSRLLANPVIEKFEIERGA